MIEIENESLFVFSMRNLVNKMIKNILDSFDTLIENFMLLATLIILKNKEKKNYTIMNLSLRVEIK
jgi:hypothetical protein